MNTKKLCTRFYFFLFVLAFGLARPCAADDVTAKPDKAVLKPVGRGWQPVFNGKNLEGWVAQTNYWKVDKGRILHGYTPGEKEHHYIYTEKIYDDFELHADVKLVG